jgi:hypothetical protein
LTAISIEIDRHGSMHLSRGVGAHRTESVRGQLESMLTILLTTKDFGTMVIYKAKQLAVTPVQKQRRHVFIQKRER